MDVANVDLNIIDVLSTQARARTYVLICGELHPLHPAGIGLPWGRNLASWLPWPPMKPARRVARPKNSPPAPAATDPSRTAARPLK
jgi:hypothetical protein